MGLFKSDEEKKKEFLSKGLEFADKNEHEKALKEFEKIIKNYPKDPDALFNIGFVYSDMKNYTKAYETFKTLINSNPKHVEAFNQLGLIFARQSKYNDAIFVYDKGIEQNPDAAVLYNNRGNVYYDMGKFQDALINFKKAGELDPVYTERLYHLGIGSFFKGGREDDAIAKLEEASKKNINKAKNAHDLGVAYNEKHMHDKAIEAFNRALSIDPNYLSAYINLGHAYQHKDDLPMAIKAFEKAIILNPKSAKLYNTIGLIYDKLNKPDIAVKAYRKAVQLDPTYANSHYMLGQLYQNRGNTDKAVAEFTKHVRIHEEGSMVDDAIQRIADMKKMSFEQVNNLFEQYREKKSKKTAPVPQGEKKDMKDYMKGLKEKINIKKSSAPSPAEQPAPQNPPPASAMNPQDYMRMLKEKIKQKKTGGQPASTAAPKSPVPTVNPPIPPKQADSTAIPKIQGTSLPGYKKPESKQQYETEKMESSAPSTKPPETPAAGPPAAPAEPEASSAGKITLPPPPDEIEVVKTKTGSPEINLPMAEPTMQNAYDNNPAVSLEEEYVPPPSQTINTSAGSSAGASAKAEVSTQAYVPPPPAAGGQSQHIDPAEDDMIEPGISKAHPEAYRETIIKPGSDIVPPDQKHKPSPEEKPKKDDSGSGPSLIKRNYF